MKKQLLPLIQFDKLITFDDEKIIISPEEHDSFEALEQAEHSKKVISLDIIESLTYYEEGGYFHIDYKKNGKTKREPIALVNPALRGQYLDAIAEAANLNKTEIKESKNSILIVNGLIIFAVSFAIWIFWGIAKDAETGKEAYLGVTKKGFKKILASIAEALGSNGVLIVGGVIIAYLLFRVYKKLSNPSKGIKYC